MEGDELSFAQASGRLLVQSLHRTRSFADAVQDFRTLEAEFVERAGDDAFDVLETRRRVAETILSLAYDKHPPFEVCRDAWNDLVRLGFSGIETQCSMSMQYADCCAYDEQPDEGLAVLLPLIAKLEVLHEGTKGTGAEYPARFYENELERLGNLRDVLYAQKRGESIPGIETRREDDALPPFTPDEEQADALYDEFANARRAIFKTYANSRDRSFTDVAADYRRIEAEFISRAGVGTAFEECVEHIRARTAESIFRAAYMLGAPFAACRDAWAEFVRIGQDKSSMYPSMYVELCLANNEPEAGLAVIKPWIAEVERLLEVPKEPLRPSGSTRVELKRQQKELHELRDKLIAMQRNADNSEKENE